MQTGNKDSGLAKPVTVRAAHCVSNNLLPSEMESCWICPYSMACYVFLHHLWRTVERRIILRLLGGTVTVLLDDLSTLTEINDSLMHQGLCVCVSVCLCLCVCVCGCLCVCECV